MYKQVIVIRMDLGMSPGKMVAQGAHAAHFAALQCYKHQSQIHDEWVKDGFRKIACQVPGIKEIEELVLKAINLGVSQYVVEDLGFTEVKAHTVTALAIGPHESDIINKITGRLKLL